jgi:hypothetical protein
MRIRLLVAVVAVALFAGGCRTYVIDGREWKCAELPELGGRTGCYSINPSTGTPEVVLL